MAIITEHEQVEAEKKDDGLSSEESEESRELVKKIDEMLARAKRYRKRYDNSWYHNYDFVCGGRQWDQERARWRFSECVNMTWANIMTEIGIQTDARPKFEFTAQEFNDEQFVDILRDINDRNWEKYKWSQVVQDGLFDAKIYHVGFAEVTWDEDIEYGEGDVRFGRLDPFYCFWDPRATDINKGPKKARYFFYTEPVPTSELKLKYPEKKDKIKADVSSFEERGGDYSSRERGLVSGSNTAFDTSSPRRIPVTSSKEGMELFGGEPHTVLIRMWLRDDALEEVCEEKEVEESGEKVVQKEYLLKKKYPKGRYIEKVGNIILRDCAPGVEVDGEWVEFEDDSFPIARLVNYQYPGEFAGENEVTHARGPQKVFNYVWSYILDMFKIQGNPVTIVGDGAGADEEEITNEPGSIIHAADPNQIVRLPGTGITPGSFDLLGQAKSAFDMIQGLQDVSRGAEMPSADSGVLFEGYMEAAQTRPRLKNRALDCFLQDAGELMLKRVMQFYTKPRVFRITNKDGYPEFIEFSVPGYEEKTTPDGRVYQVKVAKMKRYKTDPTTGTVTTSLDRTVELKGDLDVKVTSGSALPYAKAQKSAASISLLTNGVIDREEVLKTLNWPNYQEVLRRMAKAEAAQSEAAQQPAPEGAA